MLHHQRTRRHLEQNRRKALREALQEEFDSNQVDLYALQVHELAGIWVNTKKKSKRSETEIEEAFKQLTGYALELIRDHGSNASSSVVLGKLAADMSRSGHIFTTYRVVQQGGKKFIVLRGKPGLRKYLNAPRYSFKNPKVMRMGVGKAAMGSLARSSILFTVIVSPATRGFEWLFLDKQAAIESVLAKISTDIVKGIIATGVGYLTGVLVPILTGGATIAVAPLAAGIFAAVTVGFGLNFLDNRLGITEKLAGALADHREQWEQAMSKVHRDSSYFFDTAEGQLQFMQGFLRR